MIRLLFLCHRYLGIAVGALMLMWCLSGIVMMYVSYPALDESSRLKHLAAIDWSGCCALGDQIRSEFPSVHAFGVEMLNGAPVLYLRGAKTPRRVIDLISGGSMSRISEQQATQVARTYVGGSLPAAAPALRGLIDYDQWTVSGRFNADRPLYHFSLNDGSRTELYVSSTTGQVVQVTTGRERFWNWLGSVPHWLYFAKLRRVTAVWNQAIIVTSLIGCFLAATGLYIGWRQWLRRPDGGWSPYHGFNLWHHIAGLLFGVLTLTWVLSGLLSINPWGLLEGASAGSEEALLRGPDSSGTQWLTTLQALASSHPDNLLSLRMAPLGGKPYLIATAVGGKRYRFDEQGRASPMKEAELSPIVAKMNAPGAGGVLELMTREDTYYFSHHSDSVQLPVYRFTPGTGSGTLYYIDPVSGSLLAKIDRAAQGYRWWHQALHRLDFAPALRGRPQWDALMLLLMSGVTLICATGTYLGYRRLVRP
jgi:uncharacterized iron-regulated membrane protein